MISLGSTISVRSRHAPRFGTILGRNLRIIRSTLDFESAPVIMGYESSIIDSKAYFPAPLGIAEHPWSRALSIELKNRTIRDWNGGPF